MTDIKTWSTTAANNNAASPDGFPEGMPPSGVNNSAREVMAAIRRQIEVGMWFDYGLTPTWQSSASFSLSTDLTNVFTVGRPVELYGSVMGTAYSVVKSSTYVSPVTTITLNDSAVGSTISQVRYSLIQNDKAIPPGMTNNKSLSGDLAISGNLDIGGDISLVGSQSIKGGLDVFGDMSVSGVSVFNNTATFNNATRSTKSAATDYKRVSPDYCIRSASAVLKTVAFGGVISLSAPSTDAKYVKARIRTIFTGRGTSTLRTVIVNIHADASGLSTPDYVKHNAYEWTPTSNTIYDLPASVEFPVINGNIYYSATRDTSASGKSISFISFTAYGD